MRSFELVTALLVSLIMQTNAHAESCQEADVQEIIAEIDTSKIVRADAPKELFGFNIQ